MSPSYGPLLIAGVVLLFASLGILSFIGYLRFGVALGMGLSLAVLCVTAFVVSQNPDRPLLESVWEGLRLGVASASFTALVVWVRARLKGQSLGQFLQAADAKGRSMAERRRSRAGRVR